MLQQRVVSARVKGQSIEVSSDYERYMRQALSEATDALERGDRPIGAVIVHNDRVVANAIPSGNGN